MSEITCTQFARVFRGNLNKRSRTARGVSDTSSSAAKKALMRSGDDLVAQVEENTQELIRSVWRVRGILPESPAAIRTLAESWNDIINRDLQDPDAYREGHEALEKIATERSHQYRERCRVNRRYRTWMVSHTDWNLAPLELESAMDEFYQNLFDKILSAQTAYTDPADVLAYADYVIDGQIHPWADGCGRNATAVLMWLSLVLPHCHLPVFGDRDEHYRSIRDLQAHTEYVRRCLAQT